MIKKEDFLDRLVDQAVREYPLDPVPPGLYEQVMVRVERGMLRPGLKFSWVDLSLSALLAGFIGIFLELIQSFSISLLVCLDESRTSVILAGYENVFPAKSDRTPGGTDQYHNSGDLVLYSGRCLPATDPLRETIASLMVVIS